MKPSKVFVVGTSFLYDFKRMYEGRGYSLVSSMEEADIIQFTGGADIDPAFYNQHVHHSTYTNPARDKEEHAAFLQARKLNKFMAGVCRGGQLLNALSGGSMYQDVSGHGCHGGHGMLDVNTGDVIPVSSLHHQMMIVGVGAELLGRADFMRSYEKVCMSKVGVDPEEVWYEDAAVEVEACWYSHTKSFCYQPHPEFVGPNHPCRNWYFDKMEELYESSQV